MSTTLPYHELLKGVTPMLVLYPHPALLTRAIPISPTTPQRLIDDLARDLTATMRLHGGLGLAANQIGNPLQMFVATKDGSVNGEHEIFINPRITPLRSYGKQQANEGCLSWPGHNRVMNRWRSVTIDYTTLDGKHKTQSASGIVARCWQHEVDHLAGINLADYK